MNVASAIFQLLKKKTKIMFLVLKATKMIS